MQVIVGTHDFSSFRAAGSAPVSPVRTILAASCTRQDSMVELQFWGTGFLYHMVRNLVGTLVDVGRHKLSGEDFTEILAAQNRSLARKTAPAQGLYLQQVFY
jgi:tRNA pseudouridine38-40 synthase